MPIQSSSAAQSSSPNDGETTIINRGKVDSVNLYEVKENELETLEQGVLANLQFGFAVFLFSVALTCIAALATSNFKWEIVEIIFICLSIIGIVLGVFFMWSWSRTRKSVSKVISTIRSRIDQDSAQEPEEPDIQTEYPELGASEILTRETGRLTKLLDSINNKSKR